MEISGTGYFVYVLRNASGQHYIGLTEDLDRRLMQHNSGVSTWSRSRGPWAMVWTSGPFTLTEARRIESFLKKQKGGAGFYAYTGLSKSGS